jgi:hypothetical protein
MEPEGSLPHSRVPATCPYPEPARSSPYPTSHSLKIYLNIILPSTPGSPRWSLSLRFPHQNSVLSVVYSEMKLGLTYSGEERRLRAFHNRLPRNIAGSKREESRRRTCTCLCNEGRGGTAALILNLGTRRRWVVSFTPRPHYTRQRIAVPIE